MFDNLPGVYAAALTPLNSNFNLDLAGLPRLLDFLAGRGCHGALLFGTTGEGPSFSASERRQAWQVALDWRRANPAFRLLGGAGTPSLSETIELTSLAFELGLDGVVTLPPYYFRKVSPAGLFAWFSQVIEQAVPTGKAFFGYHFPSVSGVPLPLELLLNLKDAFPDRFAGIKDSSGEASMARQLGDSFGSELLVLTGNDSLFSLALENHAAGCITAMANLYSPNLRLVWDSHQAGDLSAQASAQARLDDARQVLERYPPFPPLLKALLARTHAFPRWAVRPPLLPLSEELADQVEQELAKIDS